MKRTTTRTAVAAVAVGGLLALGACGSSTETTSGATSTSTATSTPVAAPTGSTEATSPATPVASDAATPAVTPEPSSSASGTQAPGAQASGTPAGSAPATPLPTPSGTVKKFATAKLPSKLGSYTGQVQRTGAATTNGMYTGTNPDEMVMVAMIGGRSADVFAGRLADATTKDHAVCGSQQGVATCVIPLSGGYISLNGTDQTKPDELAAMANELWGTLA